METQKLLSFKEIAVLIGKSRSTIWRWERSGLFPRHIQFGPNSVGWKLKDIENWLAQNEGEVEK